MANLVYLYDNELTILQEWAEGFNTKQDLHRAAEKYNISTVAIRRFRNKESAVIRQKTYELVYEVLREGSRELGLSIPDRLLGTTSIDTGEAPKRKFWAFPDNDTENMSAEEDQTALVEAPEKPVTEPVPEPVPEPVTEPVTEHVTEHVTTPAIDETLRNMALDAIAEADSLSLRKLVVFMLNEQML